MKNRKPDYKKQLVLAAKAMVGVAKPELRKVKATKDPRFFDPDEQKADGWMFPAHPNVAAKFGKVSAIAALCLFSFVVQAQDRILQIAPGMAVFEWQGDTIDTNAFPAMYRLFGCDSACAIQRTASLLVAVNTMERSEEIDFRLKWELGGVGLNHYRWLRNFLIMVTEDRKEYMGERTTNK